jgi:hypothetical protein
VFVGHERRYPVSFLAVSLSPLEAASTGRSLYRLEAYVQESTHAGWANVLYAVLDDPGGGFSGIDLSSSGYAVRFTESQGLAATGSVPAAYTRYLGAALAGRTPPPAPAFSAGRQTDELVKAFKEVQTESTKAGLTVSPAVSAYRGPYGPYVYAGPRGGGFVLLAAQADTVYSGAGAAYCLPQPPDRHVYGPGVVPGLYARIVDHHLWSAGVVVPSASSAPLNVVAGSDRTVGSDTTPCY